MSNVSTFRLYLLRAMYLLMSAGLAAFMWPRVISHSTAWALRYGDTGALLAGICLMAALGIRYPLRMLPILLFEFTWKVIWMLFIGLPLWRAHQVNAEVMESIRAVGSGVILCPIVIPWRYVYENYVKASGDRWRSSTLRS